MTHRRVLVPDIGLLGKIRDVYPGYRLDVEIGWFDRLIDCATQSLFAIHSEYTLQKINRNAQECKHP